MVVMCEKNVKFFIVRLGITANMNRAGEEMKNL